MLEGKDSNSDARKGATNFSTKPKGNELSTETRKGAVDVSNKFKGKKLNRETRKGAADVSNKFKGKDVNTDARKGAADVSIMLRGKDMNTDATKGGADFSTKFKGTELNTETRKGTANVSKEVKKQTIKAVKAKPREEKWEAANRAETEGKKISKEHIDQQEKEAAKQFASVGNRESQVINRRSVPVVSPDDYQLIESRFKNLLFMSLDVGNGKIRWYCTDLNKNVEGNCSKLEDISTLLKKPSMSFDLRELSTFNVVGNSIYKIIASPTCTSEIYRIDTNFTKLDRYEFFKQDFG